MTFLVFVSLLQHLQPQTKSSLSLVLSFVFDACSKLCPNNFSHLLFQLMQPIIVKNAFTASPSTFCSLSSCRLSIHKLPLQVCSWHEHEFKLDCSYHTYRSYPSVWFFHVPIERDCSDHTFMDTLPPVQSLEISITYAPTTPSPLTYSNTLSCTDMPV